MFQLNISFLDVRLLTPPSSAIVDWFENRPINKASREELAQIIQTRRDFIAIDWVSASTDVKMLDYACGPGFLSKVSTSYVPLHSQRLTRAPDLCTVRIVHYCDRFVADYDYKVHCWYERACS
jgi:hypothetical protein